MLQLALKTSIENRLNALQGDGGTMPLAGTVERDQGPEKAALAQQFRGSVPPVLLFVGASYAVFSGTIFLNTREAWATPLWAATMALGLMMAGAGWMVRRRPLSEAVVQALAGGLAVLAGAHTLLIIGLSGEPELVSYLAMLLAGAGYFLLPRHLLAILQASAVVGWVLVARDLGISYAGAPAGLLAAGIAVGWAANVMRTRHIRGRVLASAAVQDTLQASEERFRSLAETAKDGILLLDGEGRLTYLNPAGLTLFGLRAHEVPGRFLSPHLGSEATSPEALLGTRELAAQRRDGTTFPAELSLARTERDGQVAYTGVLRDVTERKRALEATQKASAREAEVDHLREMNEFKTRFLNMAAHELNTPLTPLRLQLHLLKAEQMGPLNEKQGKAVALLDRNVARLSGLVGELLEVARLQSGRLRLQMQPISLDEVVDEVIESFGEAVRRVGISLTYAGHQNLTVQADRNRMTQVLFNLVSNAVKFTPAGGRVTVDATDKGSHIEVSVSDTGLGLTREQQSRLFQPFSQVHDPMAITASGTGLGLYICKGLVEAQGGQISVSSPGAAQGSTFRFTLPAAEAHAVRAAVVKPADEDPIVRRLRELI